MSDLQLEQRLRELEKDFAVLKSQYETQSKELNNLKGGVSRGLWIIGGGFITAAVSWIVAGGFMNAK